MSSDSVFAAYEIARESIGLAGGRGRSLPDKVVSIDVYRVAVGNMLQVIHNIGLHSTLKQGEPIAAPPVAGN